MNGHPRSKPSGVLSDYTAQIEEEAASCRFRASLSFTRLAFQKVGGWPLTLREDFDQQLIARLTGLGPAGDPCVLASPSYVFRWRSTSANHGQALMRGPEDERWYAASAQLNTIHQLVTVEARMDPGTRAAYAMHESPCDRRS